jgi:hypothetical protein
MLMKEIDCKSSELLGMIEKHENDMCESAALVVQDNEPWVLVTRGCERMIVTIGVCASARCILLARQ